MALFGRAPVATYQQQLDEKQQIFVEQMRPFTDLEPVIFPSADRHFRMRAEFRFWHDDDDSYYAMYDPNNPKVPVRVDDFPIGSELINELMVKVREAVLPIPALRFKLFQVEFLTTQSNEALVTLCYHRQLDAAWDEAAAKLQDDLGVKIIGRARKQRKVLSEDYVNEQLTINGRTYTYHQYENSFTQPNAAVCEKMITWAQDHAELGERDLLELYCGNGNFSIPLASKFRRVLGTEISRISVKSAKENIATNQIDNLEIERMSAEDFSAAWLKQSKEALQKWDISSYDFASVLVDPPRAGLDDDTVKLVSEFEQIIYISCNPETLVNNLQVLSRTHDIVHLAAFDQFPYTHHLEAGVILRKKA